MLKDFSINNKKSSNIQCVGLQDRRLEIQTEDENNLKKKKNIHLFKHSTGKSTESKLKLLKTLFHIDIKL